MLYCDVGGSKLAFIIDFHKNETQNKTIRFPLYLINMIENQIKDKDISFSKFVIQACEYGLNNIKQEKK